MSNPSIRKATIDDLPEIIRMGSLFCEQASISPSEESISTTALQLMESNMGEVFIGDGAMAGVLAYPMFMNLSTTAAQELFWWVDEDKRSNGSGKLLMEAMESWAKEVGANRMIMLGLDSSPAHIDRFYRLSGYKPLEISYWKEL